MTPVGMSHETTLRAAIGNSKDMDQGEVCGGLVTLGVKEGHVNMVWNEILMNTCRCQNVCDSEPLLSALKIYASHQTVQLAISWYNCQGECYSTQFYFLIRKVE